MQLQWTEEMLTLIGGLIVAYFVYVLIIKKNDKPSMDSPATAHAALKEIVERAVEEARKLPGLGASEDTEHPSEGRPIADHSYEDLLATAILNKVVEKFQRERVDGNSNVLHDTDSPKAKYIATESEHGLEEDAASYMSYRRECNGNHSASIRRNGDNREPVSFMMEEQIEEVTTITSDDDEFRSNDVMEFECTRRVPFPELGMDIVDPPRELSPSPSSSSDSSDLDRNEYSARTKRHIADRAMDLISPVESWEDNWLFQKKRTSRTQPDAVAMLVPSSNAYYKALIGDRDAEDTSDLSECSSTKSDEEIEKELMEAINNVVPRTPRTSECDAKNNQTENNSEVPNVATQQDEIDICQETEIEKNLSEKICERFDEKISEKLLKSSEISEKKTIKNVNDKEKLSESSFALITVAKGEDEAKEKPKDTTDCGERIIAITVESSARKDTQSEKSSERSDQMGNVVDEDEDQRESEYTEHYDTAIQRHLDSLTKVEVCSGENEMINETAKMNDQFKELENNSAEEQESERLQTKVQLSYATNENHIDIADENDRLSAPPRPGTIAEREHKKWENAPPIENNPYSEENIRKRCLERQYSRNSDIPGAHYDLTKLNEANLEALLAPDCPDIKRFGRDYYINQSKVASGERQEQAVRSTMSSISSRPSSSLSQRSSTGNEQREQQVSHHELEQFEAASLRSSLPRRRCRDPLASPHFAINPLLHLKLVSGRLPHDDDDDNQQVQNVIENERINEDRENTIEDATENQRFRNFGAIVHRKENNVLAEDLEIDTHFGRTSANWNEFSSDHDANVEAEEPIVPRYDANRGGLLDHRDDCDPGDHDSGIGSRDSMISDRDRWRRLYRVADNNRHDGDEEISSIGGRRFWTTGGYKYHTFGGIRIRPREGEDLDDLEDESTSPPVDEDHPLEFAKLKFQTFGGIKRSRRIHGSKIPNYRRIRLRPILPEVARSAEPNTDQRRDRVMGKSRNFELYSNVDRLGSLDRLANLNRSTSFEGFASCEHSTSSTFEDSDWQNEEDDVVDHRVSSGHDIGRNRTTAFKTNSAKYRNPIRRKDVNLSSLLSFENEDNEWQDESFHSISNESIMNKCPSDSSKKRKICTFSDDDVARRGRETRSRRYREIFEEGNGRKLEKLINRNTKKSLNSSRKLRAQEEKSDDKRHRKLDERSLSDVTIW